MGLLKLHLERRLSALLGAQVTFDKLDLSLLAGTVHAEGVIVAVGGEPLLTARRLRAEVAVAKALRKEVVVKSLAVERPVLSVVIRPNGTTNLPARPPAVPAGVQESAGEAEDVPDSWTFAAEKVLVVDGAVTFRDARRRPGAAGSAPYVFAAEQVTADLSASAVGMSFTVICDRVGRRDPDVPLGQVRFLGRAEGLTDLSQWASAKLTARAELGPSLRAEVAVPSLMPPAVRAHVSGEVDLSTLASLLPGATPRRGSLPSGQVQVDLRAAHDARGLRVEDLTLKAAGLKIPTA